MSTSTQVRFRYTTSVVNLVTVLASIEKYTGMPYKEARELFEQARTNKRRFFTVDAVDATAAREFSAVLKENACEVRPVTAESAMSDADKLAKIQQLLTEWNSGELSSYDFAYAVEKLAN